MAPKRADELVDGGSLYWVIRGHILCRERILGVRPFTDKDGVGRCHIALDCKPVLVELAPLPRVPGLALSDPPLQAMRACRRAGGGDTRRLVARGPRGRGPHGRTRRPRRARRRSMPAWWTGRCGAGSSQPEGSGPPGSRGKRCAAGLEGLYRDAGADRRRTGPLRAPGRRAAPASGARRHRRPRPGAPRRARPVRRRRRGGRGDASGRVAPGAAVAGPCGRRTRWLVSAGRCRPPGSRGRC